MIQDIYLQCLAVSGQCPEIDWDTWFNLIDGCQRDASDLNRDLDPADKQPSIVER